MWPNQGNSNFMHKGEHAGSTETWLQSFPATGHGRKHLNQQYVCTSATILNNIQACGMLLAEKLLRHVHVPKDKIFFFLLAGWVGDETVPQSSRPWHHTVGNIRHVRCSNKQQSSQKWSHQNWSGQGQLLQSVCNCFAIPAVTARRPEATLKIHRHSRSRYKILHNPTCLISHVDMAHMPHITLQPTPESGRRI